MRLEDFSMVESKRLKWWIAGEEIRPTPPTAVVLCTVLPRVRVVLLKSGLMLITFVYLHMHTHIPTHACTHARTHSHTCLSTYKHSNFVTVRIQCRWQLNISKHIQYTITCGVCMLFWLTPHHIVLLECTGRL